MIVRLRNLSARAPGATDLQAVAALLIECDVAESGIIGPTEEDVHCLWQTAGFNLKTDAWVITTNRGHIVGYADVRRDQHEQFVTLLRVHPGYRGRGIGTLLIWLVEERARQLLRSMDTAHRVTLSCVVSDLDEAARHLLDRENYTQVRHFWRLVIEMDQVAMQAREEAYQRGKLKVDLIVDSHNTAGTMQLPTHSGNYVARQYNVYEKVLQAGKELQARDMFYVQCATA